MSDADSFPYEKFGFWPIIVTSLLAGTGFVFTLISGQGLIGHLSNNKNRATAFTYQSIAFSISGVTGPVVAGYLIDHGSYYWAFGGAANLCTPRRRNLSVPGAGPALGL